MRLTKTFTVIDAHTEGNPERVVVSGIPPIPGDSMLEKGRYVRAHLDHLRTFFTHEPRGHENMYAALVIPPADPRAQFGILYLEPGGYATMCGHGTIAICSVLVEIGLVDVVEPQTTIVLDTPAGLVEAVVQVEDGVARSVTVKNVPSFLYKPEVIVNVPGIGRISMDIAYGGNFYAIVPAKSVELQVNKKYFRALVDSGTRIWQAVNEQVEIRHPLLPEINCVNYVEFSGPPVDERASAKNAVVVPPAGMDRSPCGTGTSAKMAALWARGELLLHQKFVHESIIGSLYTGELVAETRVGNFPAVVPLITGSAYIMGIHQLVMDPCDPFPYGYSLDKQEKLYGFDF